MSTRSSSDAPEGPESQRPFAAVVLSGGTGARMAGAEKAALELEGRPLLAHVLDALTAATEIVVVGDQVPVAQRVAFVREEPSYGGPAAALLTGVAALADPPEHVIVLAVDMPRVTAGTVQRLLLAGAGVHGAVLVGPDGRRQLAMALDLAALQAVTPATADWSGLALRALVAELDLVEIAAIGDESRDVDTWADLKDLRG